MASAIVFGTLAIATSLDDPISGCGFIATIAVLALLLNRQASRGRESKGGAVVSMAPRGDTVVYLMRDGSRCKVGISSDPAKRLATFQTANPGIQLVATTRPVPRRYADHWERNIHHHYAPLNVGGEWFVLADEEPDDLVEVLRKL
jgi:hypothetical protein